MDLMTIIPDTENINLSNILPSILNFNVNSSDMESLKACVIKLLNNSKPEQAIMLVKYMSEECKQYLTIDDLAEIGNTDIIIYMIDKHPEQYRETDISNLLDTSRVTFEDRCSIYAHKISRNEGKGACIAELEQLLSYAGHDKDAALLTFLNIFKEYDGGRCDTIEILCMTESTVTEGNFILVLNWANHQGYMDSVAKMIQWVIDMGFVHEYPTIEKAVYNIEHSSTPMPEFVPMSDPNSSNMTQAADVLAKSLSSDAENEMMQAHIELSVFNPKKYKSPKEYIAFIENHVFSAMSTPKEREAYILELFDTLHSEPEFGTKETTLDLLLNTEYYALLPALNQSATEEFFIAIAKWAAKQGYMDIVNRMHEWFYDEMGMGGGIILKYTKYLMIY